LNDQGEGEGTNCHSPTQPQHELELDLIMGRNPTRKTTSTKMEAKKLLLVKLVYPNKDGFVHPRDIDTVSKGNRNFKEQDVGELFFSQPLPAKFN
jgi:hypothetical protein